MNKFSKLENNIVYFSVLANKPQLSKQFPNVSSESDLQKYKTAQQSHDRKSPSLSNPNTDSSRQKVRHQVRYQVLIFYIRLCVWSTCVLDGNNHSNPRFRCWGQCSPTAFDVKLLETSNSSAKSHFFYSGQFFRIHFFSINIMLFFQTIFIRLLKSIQVSNQTIE